jgi:hypothetical protein
MPQVIGNQQLASLDTPRLVVITYRPESGATGMKPVAIRDRLQPLLHLQRPKDHRGNGHCPQDERVLPQFLPATAPEDHAA